jgi:general secretion pathway protein G
VAGLRSRQKGFTLVELLVVITIMGIIAALLVVAATGARRKVDQDVAKAGIQFITSKIEAYRTKRGELPPDTNADGVTAEMEIYATLAEWGFGVPPEKQVDPWGSPYIIVFQRDYVPNIQDFPIVTGGAHYSAPPFNKVATMYNAVADMPKEIHSGDPAATPAYMSESGGYQIICAGEDGRISRDNREVTADTEPPLDGMTVNADNLTNW